jgi:hypothetical protein
MSTMSAITERHHVTVIPAHVEQATRDAQAAARQARIDGLTELECQRVYGRVYASSIRVLTAQATA